MAVIVIASKLNTKERNRLYRAAKKYENERPHSSQYAFIKLEGKNCYAPGIEGVCPYDVARHMMVVAGTTFDFKIRKEKKNYEKGY